MQRICCSTIFWLWIFNRGTETSTLFDRVTVKYLHTHFLWYLFFYNIEPSKRLRDGCFFHLNMYTENISRLFLVWTVPHPSLLRNCEAGWIFFPHFYALGHKDQRGAYNNFFLIYYS
jgi:hypothetical protein